MVVRKQLFGHEYEGLVKHISELVDKSFQVRPMPSGMITKNEAERRVEICGNIWNVLYGELNWSPDRAKDYMARFLIAVIDGKKLSDYTDELIPANRDGSKMWAPEKLQDIEPENRLSALAGSGPIIIGPEGGNNGS